MRLCGQRLRVSVGFLFKNGQSSGGIDVVDDDANFIAMVFLTA